jgi:ATP-binding cassette subfamily C protein LapB
MLLAKPKLWLLDEPTAAMDQESEERVLRGVMGSLAPDNTLIFVTHKIQLLNLVQRVIVVVNGQIALDGPTAAVLEKLRPAAPQAQPTIAKVEA